MKRRRQSSKKQQQERPPCVLPLLIDDTWEYIFKTFLNPADYICAAHAWLPLLQIPFLKTSGYCPKNKSQMVQLLYKHGTAKQIRWFWDPKHPFSEVDQWMGFLESPHAKIDGPIMGNSFVSAYMRGVHIYNNDSLNMRWSSRYRQILIQKLIDTKNTHLYDWCYRHQFFLLVDLDGLQAIYHLK